MREKPDPGTETRERIVSAARSHFLQHGFRAVTTDDIAQALGMSKKTLYAHFTSKTELLQAVLEQKLRQADADLEAAAVGAGGDFITTLHALLGVLQRHTDELQPPFVRDMARDVPQLFARVRDQRGQLIQKHFGALLTAGRKAGLVRRDIPLPIIIEILLAATQSFVTPENMVARNMTPREGFTTVLKLLLEGALTAEGRTQL